jgi:DNA-directed RNA polymerase subunit RPC12/RpoP
MMFKACTRCRGDLYREEDLRHAELVCLQCGFRLPVAPISAGRRLTMQRRAAHSKRVTPQPVRAAA